MPGIWTRFATYLTIFGLFMVMLQFEQAYVIANKDYVNDRQNYLTVISVEMATNIGLMLRTINEYSATDTITSVPVFSHVAYDAGMQNGYIIQLPFDTVVRTIRDYSDLAQFSSLQQQIDAAEDKNAIYKSTTDQMKSLEKSFRLTAKDLAYDPEQLDTFKGSDLGSMRIGLWLFIGAVVTIEGLSLYRFNMASKKTAPKKRRTKKNTPLS